VNFLHLVPKSVYDTKMARERLKWMDYVDAQVSEIGHGVTTTGPGWPDWYENESVGRNIELAMRGQTGERKAQMAVVYQIGEVKDSPVPTCVVIQEAYDRPKTLRTIREVDAKLVVFTYANEVPQYQDELESEGRAVVTIPHSGDEELFRKYGEEKTIDVLIVGSMNQTVYPHRARLARLVWRELRKRGYRVEWLPHPGYTLPPKSGLVGEAYARKINRSKLVVTCTSRHRYALAKLVEIPLCWALPVSDLPGERGKFFEETMLHVEPWRLDREILASIEDVLDDEENWLRRVKIAREKVEARLTMKDWAERFVYWSRRKIVGEMDMTPPKAVVPEGEF
jgi:hypothetical protein